MSIVKAHTSLIGDTGYNNHSRNFFRELSKLFQLQVRNFTVGKTWNGYNNDEPHNKEPYIDDVLKCILTEQTLNEADGSRKEYPLYSSYKNEGNPDVHIVLNETDHYYFYDNYNGKKIAYNVWETTRQPKNFFNKLKEYDQVWVPSKWQRDCTIEQGIPAEKVKVVPEGVDVEKYKPIKKNRDKKRPFKFVLIGRWDYRKSTKEIIQSFVDTFTDDENVELILSVDNPFASDGFSTTEERLENCNISRKNIKIVNFKSSESYIDMLHDADVFLSCARGEGWNLPLIEAMACGIPSIYSNWGGQLEFAEGRGIPVDIIKEVPVSSPNDNKYYSWTWNAPGNFAEPNFSDLSKKMRNVFENYSFYKEKALKESDEIRRIFTWENAANIGKKYIDELMMGTVYDTDSVAIVLAHANTQKRKKILKECLSSLKIETILSTNYPVDYDVQEIATWMVYSKDNPLLYPDEYEKYGVNYITWWKNKDDKYFEKPFDYEHSYAAYNLIKRGIEFAKAIGKKKIHIINYDYIISQKTLLNNENLLKEYDFVVYEYDDKKHGETAYCGGFFSGKIDSLYDYFSKYSTKEEYYKSLPGFNILEINLSLYLKNNSFNTKELKISSLVDDNKLNLEDANNYNQLESLDIVGKSFKHISDYFDCDKTTYHEYDKYYPVFFDKWRNDSINIFEIGLDEGKSMNVWENYFPFAKIWGMDISKSVSSVRSNIFIGNQDDINDLKQITSKVPKCKIIVDDGSHVPHHQLKSFYYLFENMLDWGGVYVIEDVECSYWSPDKEVYSVETGYLNLIDYFTKLNHEVNGHYNNKTNDLHIKTITYAPNCIIIQKKEKDELTNKNYRFFDRLGDMPKYNETNGKNNNMNKIHINFVDQPFVEIVGNDNKRYEVRFIDNDTKKLVYSVNLKNNEWAKCNRHWFTNWKIEVESNGEIFVHNIDLNNKKVFISFESSSLGDTIAWIPYVEEFRKKHGCHVVVSTFHNNLFKSEYSELEFLEPGVSVDNLYALYRIGVFYDNNGINYQRHKTDFRKLSLQEYAADILGLEYIEIKPKLKKFKPHIADKPYICLGIHSTAQAKYWNNPTGWQEVVDYIKSNGYDVYVLSKEEDGYMDNRYPKGIIHIQNKTLDEIAEYLIGSEGFVGVSSGLSWYAWGLNIPTTLISGFTDENLEMKNDIIRVINKNVCNGCVARHLFDKGDWNWCPDHKGTQRQFECSKSITFDMIKPHIKKLLKI